MEDNSIIKVLNKANVVIIQGIKHPDRGVIEFRDTYLEDCTIRLAPEQVEQLISELREMINDN